MLRYNVTGYTRQHPVPGNASCLCAPLRSCGQTQDAHDASDRGECCTKQQCERGSFTAGEAKAKRRERRAACLPRQARRRHDAARASAATGRCALDIKAFMFGT